MATAFFGGDFFGGEFFSETSAVVGRQAPYGFGGARVHPHRGRADVDRDRERFGVIERVAEKIRAEPRRGPELDRIRRAELLQAELEADGLAWDGLYWEMLEREAKIRTDLENRRRVAAQAEEELVILTLIASQL